MWLVDAHALLRWIGRAKDADGMLPAEDAVRYINNMAGWKWWRPADLQPWFEELVLAAVCDRSNGVPVMRRTLATWDGEKWRTFDGARPERVEVLYWMEIPPLPAEMKKRGR